MSDKSDESQTEEVVIQPILKQLQTFNKEMKQMEEQVIKMRVECALKVMQISTKVETNESINDLIESNLESKPNPEIKPIEDN